MTHGTTHHAVVSDQDEYELEWGYTRSINSCWETKCVQVLIDGKLVSNKLLTPDRNRTTTCCVRGTHIGQTSIAAFKFSAPTLTADGKHNVHNNAVNRSIEVVVCKAVDIGPRISKPQTYYAHLPLSVQQASGVTTTTEKKGGASLATIAGSTLSVTPRIFSSRMWSLSGPVLAIKVVPQTSFNLQAMQANMGPYWTHIISQQPPGKIQLHPTEIVQPALKRKAAAKFMQPVLKRKAKSRGIKTTRKHQVNILT